MLRQSQNTLFIVVSEEQLQDVLKTIHDACRKHHESSEFHEFEEHIESTSDEIKIGDAVVFVWDINQMERY